MLTTEAYDAAALAYLAAVGATGTDGPLKSAKLILFTGTPALNKGTVLSGLTQPTFPGYGSVTITWGSARRDADGNISLGSQLATFQMNDATTPTIVTGFAILDHTGATVYITHQFDEPVNLVDALSFLGVVVEVSGNNESPGTVTVVR